MKCQSILFLVFWLTFFKMEGQNTTTADFVGSFFGFPIIDPGPMPSGAFLYMPSNGNALSIKAQYDFQVSFNHKLKESTNWNFDIKNFNLSFSPIPHIYATAHWLQIENDNERRFFDSKMRQGGFGIGGYYFKELGNVFKKKNIFNKTKNWMMSQKGILVNGLLGYSRGKITHHLNYDVGYGRFLLNKFYGQVGFDYQARIWGVSGVAKVGGLNYGTTYLEANAPRDLAEPVEILKKKNNFMFSEMEIRAYLGIRYGEVYWSWVKTTTNDDLSKHILSDYRSVGILLEFQEIFKKKNKDL